MNTSGYFFKPFNTDSEGIPISYQYMGIYKVSDFTRGLYTDYPISVIFQKDGFVFYNQALTNEYEYKPTRFLSFCTYDNSDDNIRHVFKAKIMLSPQIYTGAGELYHEHITYTKRNYDELPDLKNFFLDFLFDFFHSNVFTGNPYYEAIKNHLLTSPITNALIKKLEYSYYKEGVKSELFATQKVYYEGRLENATKEWLALIRNKQYENVIHPNNCWFEPIETEHQQVFYENKHIFKIIKEIYSPKPAFIESEAETSVQWLVGRYNLWEAFVLQFGFIFNCRSVFSLLFAFGLFLLFVIEPFYKQVGLGEFMEEVNQVGDTIPLKIILCLTKIFIAFIFGVIAENLLYFFGTLIFYSRKIESISKWHPKRSPAEWLLSIPKLIEFFKPKILVASAVIWGFLFTSERFWNLDFNIGFFEFTIILVLAVSSFSVMVARFKPLLPIKDRGKQACRLFIRSSFLFLLSLVYSFILGIVTMSFNAESILTKDDFLKNYFSEFYENENISNDDDDDDYKSRLDTTTQNKLDTIFQVNQVSTDTSDTSEIIAILKEIQKPRNVNKELFKNVLPNLTVKGESLRNVVYIVNVDNEAKRQEFSYARTLYIFPEMLLFYTVVTVLISILAEIGFRKPE
jgi:hypothetical protein